MSDFLLGVLLGEVTTLIALWIGSWRAERAERRRILRLLRSVGPGAIVNTDPPTRQEVVWHDRADQ